MEEDFRALLTGDAGVSAITSSMNFGAHPQGQPLPAIVLNVISRVASVTLSGAHSLTESRVQVDCYADTYGAAKSLSRAVVSRLHAFKGGFFQGVFLASMSDSRTDREVGIVDQPFRVSMDFTVFYNQP